MKITNDGRGAVLSESAQLASVRISQFGSDKKDKQASAQLAVDKKATKRSVKVSKRMYDECFPKTRRQASRLRNDILYNYTFALPMNGGGQQKGPRLLPTKLAETFLDDITSAIDDFHNYADEECAKLDEWQDRERERLGDLYKESDYMSSEDVRSKFHAEVFVDGLPTIENINAGRHSDRMKAQASERESRMVTEVNKQLLIRMLEHVSHLANTLDKEKTKIFPSLIDNVRDLVEVIIPASNINDDPEINDLCESMKKTLRYTADQIKATPSAKKAIQATASKVAKQIGKSAKTAGVTKDDLSTVQQTKASAYF